MRGKRRGKRRGKEVKRTKELEWTPRGSSELSWR